MAYLGKYIREILLRREPVVFPGFGSLVVIEGKGVAGEDGRIDPPGPVIRFDPTHPRGDGKLAVEYATGEGIDPEEARQQVLELVDAIKFKLDKGEKFVLEQVGTFSRDDDNKIHFRKELDWQLDPDVFGLDSLDILELENDEGGDFQPEETATPEPVVAEVREGSEDEPSPDGQRKPVNKWKIIWIVTGSLIVVLLLILLIPAGNGIEFDKEGIIIRDMELRADDIPTGPAKLEKGDERVAEEQEETVLPEEPAETALPNRHFIIAGSFQNLSNATELKDQLSASGFPSEIIFSDNRMYRVSIRSYATREAAEEDLRAIRSASGIGSAWVLSR
ncbi:MAG: SPOR domain-containing protein [Bacteroidales bacterium]|nr:SPOR domain-containing protein [Bacteroidales bacterium]